MPKHSTDKQSTAQNNHVVRDGTLRPTRHDHSSLHTAEVCMLVRVGLFDSCRPGSRRVCIWGLVAQALTASPRRGGPAGESLEARLCMQAQHLRHICEVVVIGLLWFGSGYKMVVSGFRRLRSGCEVVVNGFRRLRNGCQVVVEWLLVVVEWLLVVAKWSVRYF